MDFQQILTLILGLFAAASLLGALAAAFSVARSKAIISTLKESNDAYKEQNALYKEDIKELKTQVTELSGRVEVLMKMKSPSLQPIMNQIQTNHQDVMTALGVQQNG